jgi:hypothetical protein
MNSALFIDETLYTRLRVLPTSVNYSYDKQNLSLEETERIAAGVSPGMASYPPD